jgi:N-methylhydantoinase B
MFDQMFAVGGALRRIDFVAEPGTITNAIWPSSVSLAVLTLDQCIALANLCLSKMFSCSTDPELQKEAQGTMGTSTFPVAAYSGQDADGNVFANLFTEPMGAGMAAWGWRDGIDAGGWSWDPLVSIPNVEEIESIYPILYLWRRIAQDSGGAGEFRGGNSMEIAAVAHGVDAVDHHAASAAHHALPLSPMYGSYPTDVSRFAMFRGTDAREQFAAGKVPRAGDIKADHEEEIPAKASGIRQDLDDVFVFRYIASGGYGDPLLRDPQLVATDVARGMVSAGEAERLYGVILGDDGSPDLDATEKRRFSTRDKRRSWAGPDKARRVEVDSAAWRVGPNLQVSGENGTSVLSCGDCGTVLSALTGNWKDGALVAELPVQEGNVLLPPTETLLDEDFVLRQFACPGCARLLDSEVRRKAEPPLWDLRIEGEVA